MNPLRVALAAAALAAAALAQGPSDAYLTPGPEHRVFFQPHDAALARLQALGAIRRVVDYGAFVLGIVDERLAGGRAALLEAGLDVRDELAVVEINAFPLDTADAGGLASRLATIPDFLRADERAAAAGGQSLWIVQFAGPIRKEWLGRLVATGAAVISPMANDAYVVSADATALQALAGLGSEAEVQWIGAYHPYYKLSPALRGLDFSQPSKIDVTIQLIAGDGADRFEDEFRREGLPRPGPVSRVLNYVDVRVRIAASRLPALAADAAVFGIEPLLRPRRHDEIQCQEVAGNLNAALSGPSGTGYLTWLASKGFAQASQFTFVVDMSDTGIDRGSTTDVNDEFKTLGPGGLSRIAYVHNYSNDPIGDCADGHGNLGASVLGGYNALAGSAYHDAQGYSYGLGICPFVQIGASKVFDNNGNPDFLQSATVRLGAAYAAGARISNNSWGASTNFYLAECQEHDALVRDTTASSAGNQQMVIVFSAGNDGAGPSTIAAPATAKNVISVGASESNRQTGADGCTIANSGADNVRDIILFSSRGPCSDQRKKPDIMAPGTHIQGAVSRSILYNAGGVCNFSWPVSQNLYTWGSGTSFSSPAISGAAALMRQWFLNQSQPVPSPALTKALLMTSTRYMTGAYANDTLWSNNQGMGLVDLGRAIDATPRILVDQTTVFGSTGQTYVLTGTIASLAQPFRVGLVWTDAPGPTTGNAYVNNLDLQVTVNGTLYRGNVFSGDHSVTGGSADTRNNAEFVFLPAGTTGTFSVTVIATNIAGDGVPGNSDTTDQDFALVVYNGTPCSPSISSVSPPSIAPPLTSSATLTVTGSCFAPISVVYANGTALATTYVNPTTLSATLPVSVSQTQIPGALCINVQNGVSDVSNSVALVMGSGNNAGLIRRQPLAPAPGSTYSILIEGGVPNAPLTFVGDLGVITPLTAFPDPVTNLVLAVTPIVGSPGPLIVVFDGLGVFGASTGTTFDATGRFTLPGIYLPNPPVGISATLQVAYLDASSPIGVRLTWARFPESL